MIAMAVDDERAMLETLVAAVCASPNISSVADFSSCSAALEWTSNNPVDVAFLDISMRGMGGLTLAEKIQEIHPQCKIVFCTGFSEYAVDAFKIHVSGYLMKPITPQAVQSEIDHIMGVKAKEKLLTVKCYGNFEVLSHGEPLRFKRNKSKELFAYLVDRQGAAVSAKEICTKLWDDDSDDSKNMDYLRKLVGDLSSTLDSVDASQVLIRVGNHYAIDPAHLDCDHYSNRTHKFHGEYMTQYSWAEETCALLLQASNH